jgi:hypothetical protein
MTAHALAVGGTGVAISLQGAGTEILTGTTVAVAVTTLVEDAGISAASVAGGSTLNCKFVTAGGATADDVSVKLYGLMILRVTN